METQGGHRVCQKSVLKKNSIRAFIGNLRGKESHYNRLKSMRIYFSSGLTIKNYQRSITVRWHVIFKLPKSRFAGYYSVQNLILFSVDLPQMSAVIVQCKITKLKNLQLALKSKSCLSIKLSIRGEQKPFMNNFDKQRTTRLHFALICNRSRTPIQQTFYARQLGLHNVCVLDVEKQRIELFVWTEDQAARGSTEVASTILNSLHNYDFAEKTYLWLFCDDCEGQNKSMHVYCMHWCFL